MRQISLYDFIRNEDDKKVTLLNMLDELKFLLRERLSSLPICELEALRGKLISILDLVDDALAIPRLRIVMEAIMEGYEK